MPRGGKREGAGRPPAPDSKSVGRSIRVTPEVDEYLRDRGTGRIEDVLRESDDFREWRRERGSPE